MWRHLSPLLILLLLAVHAVLASRTDMLHGSAAPGTLLGHPPPNLDLDLAELDLKSSSGGASLVTLAAPPAGAADGPLVILWHGLGDACCADDGDGLTALGKWLGARLPQSTVVSVRLGPGDPEKDRSRSFFSNISADVNAVCAELSQRERVEWYGFGLSQGALFLRILAQTCGPEATGDPSSPRALRLISLGGPQRGVSAAPPCPSDASPLCERERSLVVAGAYLPWVRDHVVPAQCESRWGAGRV